MPFWFVQDDYRDGVQTLIVYRWGQVSVERWDWGREYGYDHYEALLKKGATKSELYNRIKFSAIRLSADDHMST